MRRGRDERTGATASKLSLGGETCGRCKGVECVEAVGSCMSCVGLAPAGKVGAELQQSVNSAGLAVPAELARTSSGISWKEKRPEKTSGIVWPGMENSSKMTLRLTSSFRRSAFQRRYAFVSVQ